MLAPNSPRVRSFIALALGILIVSVTNLIACVDEQPAAKKREEMWKALKAKYPKESSDIAVYCENPSGTYIVFRREQDPSTYEFSLKRGSVREIHHRKAVFRVNRITFSIENDYWQLWYNGDLELQIGAEEK